MVPLGHITQHAGSTSMCPVYGHDLVSLFPPCSASSQPRHVPLVEWKLFRSRPFIASLANGACKPQPSKPANGQALLLTTLSFQAKPYSMECSDIHNVPPKPYER